MKAVIFDIGNVLVAWDPRPAFLPELGTLDAVQDFMARIGFDALNRRADQGARFADLAEEVENTADREILATYLARFHLTIEEAITGTWDIARRLRANGVALHGITNWSAETWPIGCAVHPGLETLMDQIVVSGQERVLKPDPEIFAILCNRTGLAPQDCLFIDDSKSNVAGARQVGMEAVHFTSPAALEAELTGRRLL